MKNSKKVSFKGLELIVGDMIAKDYTSESYLIVDFQEDSRPICRLIDKNKPDTQPYPFNEVVKIGGFLI